MTGNAEPGAATERLNRFLARAGVGSRRRADLLIAAGRVTVNGAPVEKMATLVDPGVDTVTVDGRAVAPPVSGDQWIVLHKVAGTLTARRDSRGRPTIFGDLPERYQGLIPVGRLDWDTVGVILLTSDGYAANRLMHPRYQIERIYEAHVTGQPSREALRHLKIGIDLGDPTPARAEARVTGKHRAGAVMRLTRREGRKREIKRMLSAIGHPVLRLVRVSFAGITARGLKPGTWRALTKAEIARLTSLPDSRTPAKPS